MRRHLKKPANSPTRFPRSTLTTVLVVTAILAIAAGTVVSRQQSRATRASEAERSRRVDRNAKLLTVNVPGQEVEVDRQTGQQRELTPDEARRLAGGLKQVVNQSTEGLVEVQHADGSVSVKLKDRFQNVTVARVNNDGSMAQSCVDNPKAAGAFFRIDPKLIDPTVDTPGPKAAKVSPASRRN